MKKLFLPTVLFVFLIIISFSGLTASAESADNNFDLLLPSPTNYLNLTKPEVVAIEYGLIAVYDRADNSVNLAGKISKKIKLTLESNDEYVTQMVIHNSNLYILTCYSAFYNYNLNESTLTQKYIDTTISSIFINDKKLYIYDGLFSIIEINLNNNDSTKITDSKKRLMHTITITVLDSTVYALTRYGDIVKFDLITAVSTVLIGETKYNHLCLLNNKLIAFDNTFLYVLDFNGQIISSDYISTIFPETINLKNIATDNENIVILEPESCTVKCFDKNFEFVDIYGDSSNYVGWFNNPSEIISPTANTLFVWDKGNHRITKHTYDDSNLTTPLILPYSNTLNPSSFAVNGESVYLSSGNKIIYSDKNLLNPTTVLTGYDISYITISNNTLYLVDKNTNAIYYSDILEKPLTNDSFKFFCNIPYDTVKIKAVEGNNTYIYAMTNSGIYLYGKHKVELPYINFDEFQINNPCDFNVDYVGNIYLSCQSNKNDIIKFKRTLNTFEKIEEIKLNNNNFFINQVSSFAFNINDASCNIFALCSDKNMLIKLNYNASLNYVSKPLFNVNMPFDLKNVKSPNQVGFATINNTTLVYKYDNIFNIDIDSIQKSTKVIVFNQYENSNLSFIMTETNNFGYVDKNNITTSLVESNNNIITARALHDTVNVYAFPNAIDSQFDIVDKNTIFTIIDNANDFNNNLWWSKVSYKVDEEEYLGYVLRTRIIEYKNLNINEKPKFAKVKSSRIGAKVNLYALEDSKSAIITTLTDGAKVKLLETFDTTKNYILVEYNDKIGYINTSELTLDKGLTNGQVLTIIIACIVLTSSALYVFISRRNK